MYICNFCGNKFNSKKVDIVCPLCGEDFFIQKLKKDNIKSKKRKKEEENENFIFRHGRSRS